MIKVKNVINESSGKAIANQFIIEDVLNTTKIFQSYNSIIAKIIGTNGSYRTYLDYNKWDYSVTTGRYRNQFLGEDIAETRKKIKSGEYTLMDLNKYA